jgi:hypothetical protein
MCNVLVRKVLDELNAKPFSEKVLPPLILATDLNCNGTVYTSQDLVKSNSTTGNIFRTYTSYNTLNTSITPTASSFTNENLHEYYIYLPRKYTGTLGVDELCDELDNKFGIRSMIVPPQWSTVTIEGIANENSNLYGNNKKHIFRYVTRGPTIIENVTSLKYPEADDIYDTSQGFYPVPAYMMREKHTNIISIVKQDLLLLGYEFKTYWRFNGIAWVEYPAVADGVAIFVQYRVKVTQPDSVETLIRKSCMGDLLYYGGMVIDRYRPQSPFCDNYMRSYCSLDENKNLDMCGCFKDEPTVLSLSETEDVALPVTCYGTNCSSKTSYKTFHMKQMKCSRMLCKQVVKGIDDAGENILTCNGQYFNHNGQVKLIKNYYNIAAATEEPAKLSSQYESKVSNDRLESTLPSQPVYVWICLAMAYLIILIFAIFYMFPPSFFTTVSETRSEDSEIPSKGS